MQMKKSLKILLKDDESCLVMFKGKFGPHFSHLKTKNKHFFQISKKMKQALRTKNSTRTKSTRLYYVCNSNSCR